jgi:hypothetical protein
MDRSMKLTVHTPTERVTMQDLRLSQRWLWRVMTRSLLKVNRRVRGIGEEGRPRVDADNLTAICEPSTRRLDVSQPYGLPRPVTETVLPCFTMPYLTISLPCSRWRISQVINLREATLLATCFTMISSLVYSSTWRGRRHVPPKYRLRGLFAGGALILSFRGLIILSYTIKLAHRMYNSDC